MTEFKPGNQVKVEHEGAMSGKWKVCPKCGGDTRRRCAYCDGERVVAALATDVGRFPAEVMETVAAVVGAAEAAVVLDELARRMDRVSEACATLAEALGDDVDGAQIAHMAAWAVEPVVSLGLVT